MSVRVSVEGRFQGISCRLVSLTSECKLLEYSEVLEGIIDTVEVNGSSPFGPTSSNP